MFDLSKLQKTEMCYLGSCKMPYTYYTHQYSSYVDTYKENDGEVIIRRNTLLHCFFNGEKRIYWIDSKGNCKMITLLEDTQEFYVKYANILVENKLKEPTIKKFIEEIKEYEE